ncbi:outer membrane beta-barrel protein [Veronia nyctiphanis]|nr:outer membrane beta-barrel protein [Veronia nyctiphanis]
MKKLILLAAFFSANAFAQFQPSFYIGAGYGDSHDIKSTSDNGGSFSQSVSEKTKRGYVGVKVNPFLGFEGQYVKYDMPNNAADISSMSVAGTLGCSFNSGFRPYLIGGVGISVANSNRKDVESEARPSLHYGVGIEYTPPMLKQLTIRLSTEKDRIYLEGIDNPRTTLGSTYLGVSYNLY